jgi:hypothetical protein
VSPLGIVVARVAAAPAWVARHGHALLGVAGLCAEGAAQIGTLVGGPAWLQGGHVLFVALCGAGVVSTAGKARVAAVEAILEELVLANRSARVAARAADPDDEEPPSSKRSSR